MRLQSPPIANSAHGEDFLGRIRPAIIALAAIGIATTVFLSWVTLTSANVVGCSDGGWFSCNAVLKSRFSRVLGVPVGVMGALTMLTILLPVVSGRPGRYWIAGCATFVAAGAAIWFVSLQLYLQKFCLFCLIAHLSSLGICAMMLRLPQMRTTFVRCAPATLTLLVALVVVQVFGERRPGHRVEAPTSVEFETVDLDFKPLE